MTESYRLGVDTGAMNNFQYPRMSEYQFRLEEILKTDKEHKITSGVPIRTQFPDPLNFIISNFNILDKSNTEWMQKLQIQQSATKAKEH